ncbi:MAG TPA: DUF255 domain-containing protein [Candidatus Baltobacteraceae bacterium]|jgi:hypothetical protein|nr:DUF255 domain-containing protein [Candidatus Baltobacteraceae bacterium]
MSELHFSPRPNRAHEIAWRSWSPETFAEAKFADKPILLALSAVWCHWCHVMDETSYSDGGVIAAINESFIPVRVDADQRPDINARYNAGGWPTTAFLTPEGEVLNAQTYIPPDGMRAIMSVILEAYRNRRVEIAEAFAHRREHLSKQEHLSSGVINDEVLRTTLKTVEDAFDGEHGGFGSEPKFPQTDVLEFVALEFARTRAAGLERILSKTLSAMSGGGMYDHVEGGFFRYSTTRDWSIPHFEKMSEDHAGLIRVYARAWRSLGTPALRETLLSAIAYVRGTLRDGHSGLFAGSQDADETYYASTLEERRRMPTPYIDRTSYTNWTAALAGAFAVAGHILADETLVAQSLQTLDTIADRLIDEEGLYYHFLAPGESPGLRKQLTDQAAYLRALLDAFEASGERRLLSHALSLIERIDEVFSGEDGALADHAGDPLAMLSVRMTPLPENASIADSLLRLSVITGDERYRERAERILRTFASRYARYRTFASPYASAVARYLYGGANVTIVGIPRTCIAMREAARTLPDPFLVIAVFSADDPLAVARGLRAVPGACVAYVCRGTACSAPLTKEADIGVTFDALNTARR